MALARALEGEILSVDSMQVYRDMDIGTAKPTADQQLAVPHHLLDLAAPEDEFSVAQFQDAGRAALADVAARGRTAIVAGGSGLHFRALVDPLTFPPTDPEVRSALEAMVLEELQQQLVELDPAAPDHIDMANPRRVLRALEIARVAGEIPSQRAASAEARAVRRYEPLIAFVGLGIDPGDDLEARVTSRFDEMLAAGLLEEVAELGPRLGRTASQAVGYKQLLPVVAGDITPAQGRQHALRATLALAKRQRTFFRRDPRIRWLTWQDDVAAVLSEAQDVLDEVGT
jgi:tRNA dimethylallyltransferase